MEDTYKSYTHRMVTDPWLAADVHQALAFGPNEKHEGKLRVSLRFSNDHLSVSSQSDEVSRQFTIASDGRTFLTETLPGNHPSECGRERTSTYIPGQPITQEEMVGFENQKKTLTGKEAFDEINWHFSMASDIRRLAHLLFDETDTKPQLLNQKAPDASGYSLNMRNFIQTLNKDS